MPRDRYGGCLDIRARASGFFRVEQIEGRWWLVTPDGHGFLSVGFNHLELEFLQMPCNREHWAPLLADAGFYTRMAVDDARAWNMTALGYGSGYRNPPFPHVAQVKLAGLSTWMEAGEFPDPFEAKFAEKARETAHQVCEPRRDDPFLIGYFLNDCLEWPRLGVASKRRGLNWIDALKSRDGSSAGKRAYVELMRERHGEIGRFNAVYGTSFATYEALESDVEFVHHLPADGAAARGDDEAFLEVLARRFYGVACAAIWEFDDRHLILGEVLEGNRGIPDPVLRAASEHFDVLSVQFYGAWKDQAAQVERWHAQSGLPVLLADSCYAVATPTLPRPCGPVLESHAQRADAFERYARAALSAPHVVGWHWCGYIDGSLELEPCRQHMGLKDAWGRPHQPLCERISEVFAQLYEIGSD